MNRPTNFLLAQLPEADVEAVLRFATRVKLKLGEDLMLPGEPIVWAHFVTEGVISTVNELSDGRSVEAFMVGPEGMAGIEAATIPMQTASRQTIQVKGEAWRLETARLRVLTLERPALREALARYHAGVQRELEQTAACHALHHAERRLAKWLLRVHDRVEGDVIKLTQEYMAAMLGSQRTTVNEAAQQLQAQGAVRYSRGVLHVLDRPALEAAACECYRKVVEPLAA